MLLWIPLLPFLGFLVNNFGARRLPKKAVAAVASGAMFVAFVASVTSVRALVSLPAEEREVTQTIFTWIGSADFQVPLGLRLDPLSAVMILVVTGIGFLIHLYSTAYMIEEEPHEYARYFAYLNLFAAFMLLLVLGENFLVLFVGWEGVGLCSYLLIGFWYKNRFAADAGKKAFIVNRIGDVAFILGVLLAFTQFGSVNFKELNGLVAGFRPEETFGVVSAIALLLFIGATGKSAQIPLYVWLPDAMEGPTPVSALIHAATMVTAGVYLIGRNAVIFAHAPEVLTIVAVVGTATALWAGAIGMVQNDIKRVLAYSTVSQLGYMFMAMGAGAYAAGIFHLFTHAFFKALLFLGSGAVIHALAGEQDLRHMGGLKKELPITYWTFLVGALAIAGVPGLAGFFSKDEILYRTFAGGHTLLWTVGAITSLMTAFYMFRLVFLAFHGERRTDAEAVARGQQAAGRRHLLRLRATSRTQCRPSGRLGRRDHARAPHASPRCAARDGAAAHRPGDRLGARRLSQCAGGARRFSIPGALPRAELACSGCGRDARRGRTRQSQPRDGADDRVVAHRDRRHRRCGVPVSEAADDSRRDGRTIPRRVSLPRQQGVYRRALRRRRGAADQVAFGACAVESRCQGDRWRRQRDGADRR